MKYEIIQQGLVTQREPGTPTAVSCSPHAVVTPGGELVCSYVVQSAMGVNDFRPMISRSNDGGTTWQEQGAIWPHLCGSYSIFGSISRAPDGAIFFLGSRTPIDRPGAFHLQSTPTRRNWRLAGRCPTQRNRFRHRIQCDCLACRERNAKWNISRIQQLDRFFVRRAVDCGLARWRPACYALVYPRRRGCHPVRQVENLLVGGAR